MALLFNFRAHPVDPDKVPRPFASVQLAMGLDSTAWASHVLVDSGAKISIFPQSFAEIYLPTLDFSPRHPRQTRVNWRGQMLPLWIHDVEIRVRSDNTNPLVISGPGTVAFWRDRDADGRPLPAPAHYPLLGQIGALDHLVFTELAGRKIFWLEPDVLSSKRWREFTPRG